MPEYIAEQYLAAGEAATASHRADAARLAAEQLTDEGTAVQLLCFVFVPDDETCIYIYEADSAETVRAAAARASLRLERISEALGPSEELGGSVAGNRHMSRTS